MKWTIGYITAGTQDVLLNRGIASVRREAPDAELIVVGGDGDYDCDVHVPFDEGIKSGWITRKKNIIAERASCTNICILHDYLGLNPGWLQGNDMFGYDWITCMHKVLNHDGRRYRDWCVIYNDAWMNPPIDSQEPPEFPPGRMMDYKTRGHERWQYYSGSYFCAKKCVLEAVPLDENRTMGGGEDVQWSRLVYQLFGPQAFTMNTLASVSLLKQKPNVPWQNLPCL